MYVKALFFLCFLQTILHNSHQFEEYYGCEDVSGFINNLSFSNFFEAFNWITLPLECSTCPNEVKRFRSNLLLFVRQGRLDVKNVVLNLKSYGYHNRNDILITTLMALHEYSNLPVNFKLDIRNVLFYLMKKRFLRHEDFSNERRGFDIGTGTIPNLGNAPGRGFVSGYTSAIRVLLEKLLQIERRWNPQSPLCQSPGSTRPILNYWLGFPHGGRVYDNSWLNIQRQEQTQLMMRLQRLIQLIPVGMYPKEKIMYEKLRALLQSSLVLNLLKSLNLRQYSTDVELLNVIITSVLQTVHVQEIRDVFIFWKNHQDMEQHHFNFALFLDLLPRPRNVKEQLYYHLMEELFTSRILYQMVHTSDFYQTTDLTQKLIILLNELMHNRSVSAQVLEAINYYLHFTNEEHTEINFGSLITVVPAPNNELEEKNFGVLRQLLNNPKLSVLMEDVATVNLTSVQRLSYVLKTIITHEEYSQYRPVAIFYRDLLAAQRFGFSYFNLLNLLTISEESRVYVQTLVEYFYSAEFETILSSLQVSNLSDMDKLIQILQAIETKSSSTVVVQAATYFLHQMQIQMFYQTMNNVIATLPEPKEPDEITKYNIVKNFLLSQQGYELLKHIDVSLFPSTRLVLDSILKTIVQSEVHVTIKDAAEYYIDLYERLEALEFITKKEIHKKFKLTEIFLDTLDPNTLTLSQKDAFKKFFKYISQIKPDVMSHFDSWDQAHTRGQFMKLLFKYLFDQPEVHLEIKECIKVLDSLIIMDGRGALPP